MRELARLLWIVMGLTFLGGLGLGAFVGGLVAAGPEGGPGTDRRMKDFERMLDLDAAQARRVREVLIRHDREVDEVRRRLSSEQQRDIQRIHDRDRAAILDLLSPEQRKIYEGTGR